MSPMLKSVGRTVLHRLSSLEGQAQDWRDRRDLNDYLRSDRRPWRRGFAVYRDAYLRRVLADTKLLEMFRGADLLPDCYGFRLDARLVEIPWALSSLEGDATSFLDAGSSLNHKLVLTSQPLATKKITVLALAPEAECYWYLGISYIFGDLRHLDFRDNWFDAIACISTIEHVGMDNSMYSANEEVAGRSDRMEFLKAIRELS